MAALAEAVDDLKIANEPRADVANHVRFLRMHLRMLPQPYLSLDTSRMTALYFCVVGLDILGELENELKADERAAMIDWIYGLQVDDGGHGGFRGSGWAGGPLGAARAAAAPAHDLDRPHLAMTYTALATLLTLGDDLGRVDGAAVARRRQRGRRRRVLGRRRRRLRAGPALRLLRLRRVAARRRLFGRRRRGDAAPHRRVPGLRRRFRVGAGGVAGRVDVAASPRARSLDGAAATAAAGVDADAAVAWCARRHDGRGVVGRTNKPPDSCYAYWVGAALRCLGARHLVDTTVPFVLSCENRKMGGFAKYPEDTPPDLLHAFYSLSSLSWTDPRFRAVDPMLGICAHRLPPR
ncbi:prenyltransferase [Aureococcus anophagefferens]|nr:prenyltransferase [Aureococcus anophagefferens]